MLKLDLRMMAELVAQSRLPPPRDRSVARGMALGAVTPTLLESFKRLTDLLDEPDAIEVLAPLVQREIHYRLLTSDQAGRLRQLASVGSQSHLVARAIEWLKANYASPLRIEELAERVHMSASSLHHHFRQLTAMSPLQYQKWLRLNEARRLMLNEGFDAASAAFEVGYESPSQFSREYARLFGAPPRRDVVSLRSKAAPDRRERVARRRDALTAARPISTSRDRGIDELPPSGSWWRDSRRLLGMLDIEHNPQMSCCDQLIESSPLGCGRTGCSWR